MKDIRVNLVVKGETNADLERLYDNFVSEFENVVRANGLNPDSFSVKIIEKGECGYGASY